MPNRLASETSPYLLQHKDNPVDWRPWGEEAFEEARGRDVPLLLSIGYSSCHWCHVMERESFEDEATAAYMNEHFVPVKVDREELPDVDATYMDAVQAMTGHGGWPLTAFLDHDAVPFHAGTYFPPTPRGGMPAFGQVMQAVVQAWRDRRSEIGEQSPRIRERLGAVARIEPTGEPLDRGALETAVSQLESAADLVHGGFGGPPKFPPASSLELLLDHGRHRPVEVTLDAMAAGGIHDHVGGGFARYAVDADWTVPHFEKMLYDNALLARAYAEATVAIPVGRQYERPARRTLDWALREMQGPEAGFYSALDADSEGVEGLFYTWTPGEIREALEPDAAELVIEHFAVAEQGNFEGRTVLRTQPGAEQPEGLDEALEALLAARERRVRPGLDDKRIASWNALMLSALARAGALLGEDRYLEAARRCAGFVLAELRGSDGRLLRTWKDGEARIPGYLEDHAFMVEALLDLYEATFESEWYEAARGLADVMIERFADRERGGFFTTADDAGGLLDRRKDLEDHPLPSGSSSSCLGLLRLSALSGEGRYRDAAEGVLGLLGHHAIRHPQAFPHLLRAYGFALGPVREVALVGEEVGPLLDVVRSEHRPLVVVAAGPEGSTEPPLLRDRPAGQDGGLAYVCEGFACRAPVSRPEELEEQLNTV